MKTHRLNPFLFIVVCAVLWGTSLPLAQASQLDNEPIAMSLKDASLVAVLESFATILGGESAIDPAVTGSVTIELDNVPWRKALGDICQQHSINCEILPGAKPVLRVRPLDLMEGFALEAGLPEAIDLSLKKADLKETMRSFGLIAGRTVEVDEGVEGSVTLSLYGAPWSVVLEEVCDLEGCAVLRRGEVLRIGKRELASKRRADLELKEVDLAEALGIIAGLPLFDPLGVPEVRLGEEVAGTVTVDLKNASWVEILDAAVGPLGLEWKFYYGIPSRLDVGVKAAKGKPQKAYLSPHPSRGSEGVELHQRFFPAAAAPEESVARYNWQHSSQGLSAADGWRFQTSWIPFGPKLQVIVPMLVRCEEGEASDEVHLFNPVLLPIEAGWSARYEGMIVELEPPGEGVEATERKPSEDTLCEATGKITSQVVMREIGDGASAKASSSFFLPRQVGAYLMLKAGRDQVAAVMSLGRLRGQARLAVVEPDGAGGVKLEEQRVALGEVIAEVGAVTGKRFELRLEG